MLKHIQNLLDAGYNVSQISRMYGYNYDRFLRYLARSKVNFGYAKGRPIGKELYGQIVQLLQKTNLTPMEIARKLGLRSRSTIYRIRNEFVDRARRHSGDFQPRSSQQVRRCGKHGLVTTWPCVACEAEGYMRDDRSLLKRKA